MSHEIVGCIEIGEAASLSGWQPDWVIDWQSVRANRFARRQYSMTSARCGLAASGNACKVESILADTQRLQADLEVEFRRFLQSSRAK